MEPEVREFLQRISLSLGVVVLWFFINSTAGIMFDWAFVHDHVNRGNIIFYVWFVASTVIMVKLLIKLWKGKV